MLDTFTISDPNDYLHREPFCFQGIANDFDFLLAAVHTDPDEAHIEMAYLDDVFRELLYEEKDLMLIGDFNSSPEEHTDFHIIENISWIVQDGEFTNVAETKTYDNIIYISDYLTEYDTGGIFNYRQEYNLSSEDTKLISDHYPVWIGIDVSGVDDD